VFVSTPAYIELHAHSAFSFLDGSSLPGELVDAALQRGHQALALTDHDGVFGSMELAQAAAATPLRALHGAEVTVVAGPRVPAGRNPDAEHVRHVTLLVASAVGWRSLCRLLTLAHRHTRDHPQRNATRPWVTAADVCAHHEGLLCLSGCAQHGMANNAELRTLREAFGTEDLYVELQRPYLHGDHAQARERVRLARRLGLRTVATGNVHAHTPQRARLQDVLVSIRHRVALDGSEPLRRGNHTHVLATPAAMAARFADLGLEEAVRETLQIAERLEFDLTRDLGYAYPGAEDPEAPGRLAAIAHGALQERYPPGHRHRGEALSRLEHELALIARLNLSGFFALHHDVLQLAREVAHQVRGDALARHGLPPGRGRGSSVSSIVCYLTGLSHVDPIEAGLSLDRFLHDDVQSLPDIDLDFPRDIRARLIPAVIDRWGGQHAALVAAFPTYRARGAIRDIGAALGLPAAELERVARASEGWSTDEVGTAIATAGAARTGSGRWTWLQAMAEEIGGLPRHLGQHPGGMIIATRPLIDCCPVVPAAMDARQMVMWDKDSCSDAGFVKLDLLGLGMLSVVERTVELLAERGHQVDLSRIPLDDTQTYDAIQRAETTGVFQIESRAQMSSLQRTRPKDIHELAIQVAIVRPGPIQGGAINPYIERRQRHRVDPTFEPPLPHPSLRDALQETLGVIVFQDQVIEVAQAFAGYTAGQAESLRRAMSRKRSQAAIDAHRDRFIAGAIARHDDVDQALAERVWDQVRGFAGFGFPKGHAVAFGLLAYQSTWLRVHHHRELLCSLLNEQPMGFYPPDALVHEAQSKGLEVLPPDVVASDLECTVDEDGRIRVGLGYIKGIDTDCVRELVAERERHGRWRSLRDLASRAGATTTVLEQLAWAGACDALAGTDGVPPARRRRAALWTLGVLTPADGQQLALPLQHAPAPKLDELTAWQQMVADYGSTGLTTGPHPLKLLRGQLAIGHVLRSDQLAQHRDRAIVRVAGVVLARQRPQAANGMTFLLLEDEAGTINLVIPPPVYLRHRLVIRSETLIAAQGRLERPPAGGGQTNILVEHLRPVDELLPRRTTTVRQLRPASAPPPTDAGQAFETVAPAAHAFGRRR